MNLIEKILKFLWIIQQKTINNNSSVIRLNPYNPLSYIVVIIFGVISLFFLIILIIKESIRVIHLFKWF